MTDIRLQGVAVPRKVVKPIVDRTNGLTMSQNFRPGSIVLYCGQERIVKHVNFYYCGVNTVQQPGSRLAYTLDLGNDLTDVPFDRVTLVKI